MLDDSSHSIAKARRQQLNGHQSFVIWLYGLSGSGKSTLSSLLEERLIVQGYHTCILDGDSVRMGVNNDLGFSTADRHENLRRAAEIAKIMIDAGIIVIAAFISPFASDRQLIKKMIAAENYFEVFLQCPLETCEKRDVKGLYKRARQGDLKGFTGIDSPFEIPRYPDLTVNTDDMDPQDALEIIYRHVIGSTKLPVPPFAMQPITSGRLIIEKL